MLKNYISGSCLLLLSGLHSVMAGESWSITQEMRLPPMVETKAPATASVAHFDFQGGRDGWRPRHPDVHIDHHSAPAAPTPGRLHLHGTEPSNWNFVTSPRMPVEPGKRYRAAMQLRVESLPAGPQPVYFKIEFVHADTSKGSRVHSSVVPPGSLHTWHRIEVEFQAPGDCRAVWAALEKGTSSPASIDVSMSEFTLDEIPTLAVETALGGSRLTGPIIADLQNVHPRIYLGRESLSMLRSQVETDPKWAPALTRLLQIADSGLRHGPPDYDRKVQAEQELGKRGEDEQLWQRSVGNMIPHLALAYLLSDDEKYLTAAKTWVFASLSYPTWGLGRIDGMDLATGHQLAGIGLAYDWLYHDLALEERRQIREGLRKRAGTLARALQAGKVWWHKAYMQNHQWVNCAGLATSGFALCDEVDEARGWIRLAHDKFLTTLATVGDDGASHEGYGYWEYGIEYIMRYLEMSHDLLGIDLYQGDGVPHPWLERGPLYALYLSLPRHAWQSRQSVMDLGDAPRYHWYGPSYQLRNLARRYPDSAQSGLAQWLAAQMESAGVDATAGGHYLNFAWYDPDLLEIDPRARPTLHHFKDIGLVAARSDWTGNGSALVVKCGPPLGHQQRHAPYDYGSGHVHPDAGHLMFFCNGHFILRDDGYVYTKWTGNHSTVLLDGHGQKGEGRTWFDFRPWLEEPHVPRILSARSTVEVDTIICDVTPAYPAARGLKSFQRTIQFHKPHRLVITDELEAERGVMFESRLQVEGTLEAVSAKEYRLKQPHQTASILINGAARTIMEQNDTGPVLRLTSEADAHRARFHVTVTVSPSG